MNNEEIITVKQAIEKLVELGYSIKHEKGRIEIPINKVVSIETEHGQKVITMIDKVFVHSDGFKGATGTSFEPISETEYNERMDEDEIIDQLCEMELPDEYKRTGAKGLYDAMEVGGELEQFVFDTSYSDQWDQLRKECKLDETQAKIFNCIGGGRCFDKDFKGSRNKELQQIIRVFEGAYDFKITE